ncbi:MAG: hypothetical protein WBA91_02170 [Paracoccaceae bacterium]
MVEKVVRIARNERLTRAVHWAVFSVGALSLLFSVAASAAATL